MHQLRAQALQSFSIRRKECINNERNEALREDGAVIGHNVGINFHQPVRRAVATVRAHLNRETSLGIGKPEGTDDVQILLVEEVAVALCDGVWILDGYRLSR